MKSNIIIRAILKLNGEQAIYEVTGTATVNNLDGYSTVAPSMSIVGGKVNKYDMEGNIVVEDMTIPDDESLYTRYEDMANKLINEVLLPGVSRHEHDVKMFRCEEWSLSESGVVKVLDCCDEFRSCMDFWNRAENTMFLNPHTNQTVYKEISFKGEFMGLTAISNGMIFYGSGNRLDEKYVAIDQFTGAVVMDGEEAMQYMAKISRTQTDIWCGTDFYAPYLAFALLYQRMKG